jgi:uncharacterized membrane-anchored protein YitT (DUF2179 family)
MTRFWRQLIVQTVLKGNKNQSAESKEYSKVQLAKGFRLLKIEAWRLLKDIFLISIGIASAAFGLESFLLPNSFIDGGATGIALLISETSSFSLSLLLLLINIPFIIMGYKIVGKRFAVKTAIAISGLAIVIATIHFPIITNDKLLVAVFGGFFLGGGIGMAVRGGSVIDGTEVLAIALSRRFGMSMGDVILVFNILIFSVAAYLLSIEAALYSIITYLAASKTVDFIIEGIEEYIGVTIISTKSEEVRLMIIQEMGRGVTIYDGKRGYGSHGETKRTDIIYTVITRLELNKLNTELKKIDDAAFVVMNSVKDTKGGMIKKRPLDH